MKYFCCATCHNSLCTKFERLPQELRRKIMGYMQNGYKCDQLKQDIVYLRIEDKVLKDRIKRQASACDDYFDIYGDYQYTWEAELNAMTDEWWHVWDELNFAEDEWNNKYSVV